MDHDDVKKWSERYDANYDPALKEIEETLTTALGEQHYITQEQLEKVMQWKLNAQRGRRDRYIEWMSEVHNMQFSDYPRILTELHDRNPGEFDLRTVEKAYYQ